MFSISTYHLDFGTSVAMEHNGPAIKQVAEGNLPEGRSDRRERSFIACWALLNGA